MATTKTRETTAVAIPKMDVRELEIELVGDSALICHNWSQKARQQIKDKQAKKPRQAKEARDPEAEYKGSLYSDGNGGYGVPATAFKNAAVDACSHIDGITKVSARGAMHIVGDMVSIDGSPAMREDMVRIGRGIADVRYRGEFKDWKVKLLIRHNNAVLSAEQIVHLFEVAGFAVGVGEWRPSRDGSFGMFHVAKNGGSE